MIHTRTLLSLIVFYIIANILVVFMHYNSIKNIQALINGDDSLLNEFAINNDFKKLEADIVALENNVRSIVANKNLIYIEDLKTKISAINNAVKKMQQISDNDSTAILIDKLDNLTKRKLAFSEQIIDSLHLYGKTSAENIIATNMGKQITDSIVLTLKNISATREKILMNATFAIEKSGKKSLLYSKILAAVILLSGAILFWVLMNVVRKQNQLIDNLNVSERKLKEAAIIKENFLANMSHEIRTPMNAILGFTNLLKRKHIDSEAKEFVDTIYHSANNLLNIINDILDLSKIEAGMMRIEAAPFNLRKTIQNVEYLFKQKASEKKLQLICVVDDSCPEWLEGDVIRLTQILINIINNAIKFTNEGSIELIVTNIDIKNTTNAIINISIKDTGIGIAHENITNIFERFSQIENNASRKFGGTGLGLSIVKELVVLQHGSIDVKSELGKGTIFNISIPYKITVQKLPIPSNTSLVTSSINTMLNFQKGVVLIVEDNEINQVLLKHLFINWQIDFEIAKNGKEAIEKLQLNNYCLVLMDIQMPEMDGYEATYEIRNTLVLQIPIIAMTAHALAGEKEKCIQRGMNDYISKPIDEQALHKLIIKYTNLNNDKDLLFTSIQNDTLLNFKYIRLQYLQSVSGGNKDYEKEITKQFIEILPQDILSLNNANKSNDKATLKAVAHNMKTTISVMELNETLAPYLDAIEFEQLNENYLTLTIDKINAVCEKALDEATQFLKTIQ